MKHIFQNADTDRNPVLRHDLDHLGFPAAGRLEKSVPRNQPLLLEHVEVLAHRGKPHRQILHNLLLRSLAMLIDVLIHTFLINLF